MAIDPRQAARDLQLKVKLEREFRPVLRGINSAMVKRFVREYANNGRVLQASIFLETFEAFLTALYNQTISIFVGNLKLPKPLRANAEEDKLITESLLTYFAMQAKEQSRLITDTNQQNIDTSLAGGLEIAAEEARKGNSLSTPEVATTAGALLSRHLRAREETILTTEVQNAAEKSKHNEAAVLAGLGAVILVSTPRQVDVPKEWVTVGDERVRPAHVAVDSVVVGLNEAFVVDGERMMHPRDESLGATAKNIVNCRCSAIIDNDALAAIRESQFSEQLAESIGL